MPVKTAVLFASALIPALALAQAASTPAADSAAASSHAMVKAADIKWGPPPDSLPKGAEFTVMSGDPGKAGPFTVRIKAPAGYKVPRHWHPSMEAVTILEGDFHLSMGDAANAHDADFAPGDFVVLPEQMQHEASTKGGVIVQVSSMGPFVVNYVDPKDDPRKATASK
jgi:quercetin dioxygenase-like cupin family protein